MSEGNRDEQGWVWPQGQEMGHGPRGVQAGHPGRWVPPSHLGQEGSGSGRGSPLGAVAVSGQLQAREHSACEVTVS